MPIVDPVTKQRKRCVENPAASKKPKPKPKPKSSKKSNASFSSKL